jgi:hypothetical protein
MFVVGVGREKFTGRINDTEFNNKILYHKDQ